MTTAPQPQSKRRRASRRRRNAASRVVFDWLSLLLLLLLLLLLFLYTKGRSAVEWEWRFHSLAGNRRNGATDNKGGPRLRSVNLDLDWSTNVKTSNLNSCSSVPWNSFQAISSHCTSFPKERRQEKGTRKKNSVNNSVKAKEKPLCCWKLWKKNDKTRVERDVATGWNVGHKWKDFFAVVVLSQFLFFFEDRCQQWRSISGPVASMAAINNSTRSTIFFSEITKKTKKRRLKNLTPLKKKSRPLWGRFFYDFLLLNFFFEMESVSGG